MSSFIEHMKKSPKQLKAELESQHGIVGQWQDYPTNWEQEQDADQDEIAELNKQEYLEEQKELEENNPTQSELLRDVGMSLRDFI
jgi:hypothetical protein